jgi:hypothetical protein
MVNKIGTFSSAARVGAWLMLGVVVYICTSNLVPANILYTDDAAFSIGLAKTILRGEVLWQGVPSHLGGRHLGPWYNYIVALCLLLTGNDLTWTFRILALVNLFGFGLAAWLAYHIAPVNSKWWAVIGLCWVLVGAQYTWLIRVPWISNFLLVPATLTFALAWLVIAKGPRYLSPYICASTWCLQTHLASGPMLVGIAIVTGLSTLNVAGREKLHKTWTDQKVWHLTWLAVLVCLWFPLLVYEIW